MRKILLMTIAVLFCFISFAQSQNDRLSVFLDCSQTWLCEYDYVRSEIKSVDFVRDRVGADVHILINTQQSSSGGTRAQLNFIGLGKYQAINDTLFFFTDPTATQDEQRKRLVQ